MKPLKKTTGTKTAAGFIPHLEIKMGGNTFLAPVKIMPPLPRLKGEPPQPFPEPMKWGGKYVYALPGGGGFCA